MHRRLWPGLLAAFCLAPAASAATVRNDASITLVPDHQGHFSGARVIEEITISGAAPGKPLVVTQDLTGWRARMPIVIGPTGAPLTAMYDRDSGQLTWTLPPDTTDTVLVRFQADNVVQETFTGSRLDLAWLSRWNLPVADQKTTILFPQGFIPQRIRSSWDQLPGARPEQVVALGVQALQVHTTQLPAEKLVITFAPKLVSAATPWYALVSALALLSSLTLWRLGRLPYLRRTDPRDPSPAELAYLCAGEGAAVLTAHLDLELQESLLRGGQDFHVFRHGHLSEPYLRLVQNFYAEPRSIHEFFQPGNPLYGATVSAVRDALLAKGLLRDTPSRRQAGIDLLAYWAVTLALATIPIVGLQAWHLAWMVPWLALGGGVYALHLAIPLYLIWPNPLTALARRKIRKYELLLIEGMHNRDPLQGYRLQMAYGAAFMGLGWLDKTLPPDHVAVYRSVTTDVARQHPELAEALIPSPPDGVDLGAPTAPVD